MTNLSRTIRVATPMILAACAAATAGEPYSLDWFTTDGGGGTSAGGAYAVSGTIGQHDASPPLTGGSYTLTGGFWAGAGHAPGPCNSADLAEPFGLLDLADINAFVSGFVTQDPIADINPDGLFDLSDINAFVTAFVAGCP